MQNQPQYIAFDKKAVFDEEIQPVLEHLTSLLRHYDIPYFFCSSNQKVMRVEQNMYLNLKITGQRHHI